MNEAKEHTFVVGIFGEDYEQRKLIGQALGAPDTQSDMEIYGRLDLNLGFIFTALTPKDYPDKIKSFLQILKISDIHVLIVDLEVGLNSVIGEILVGMDLMHQLFDTRCLVIIQNINEKTEWKLTETQKKITNILNTTSLESTDILLIKNKDDYETIKSNIAEIGKEMQLINKEPKNYVKVIIDHAFPVKGIGTVILGIVKEGEVKTGQMVEITGYEGPSKKVIIRSIQKHDRDFKSAQRGDRVGLALKGNISPKDIDRDNIIVSQGIFTAEKDFLANVYINPFYKPKAGTIKPGDLTQFHGIVEIKVSPLKFVEGDELTPGSSGKVRIQLEKNLVHDGSGLKGIITEMNRFENKLRIVGWFTQILD